MYCLLLLIVRCLQLVLVSYILSLVTDRSEAYNLYCIVVLSLVTDSQMFTINTI